MWELVKAEARRIDSLPLEDRGFLLGDGVFETFRIADGQIRHSELHAASLQAGCAALDLTLPDWPVIEAAVSGVSGPVTGRAGKLIITRGKGGRGLSPVTDPAPRTFFQHFALPPKPEAVRLVTVSIRRSTASLAARYKTLSYVDNLAARREAAKRGGDVALLLTESGLISGCDSANLFWMTDGQIFTPSEKCGIRNGVMRRCVLHRLDAAGQPAREIEAGPEALKAANAVWMTNAVTGLVPVLAVDGCKLARSAALISGLMAADL